MDNNLKVSEEKFKWLQEFGGEDAITALGVVKGLSEKANEMGLEYKEEKDAVNVQDALEDSTEVVEEAEDVEDVEDVEVVEEVLEDDEEEKSHRQPGPPSELPSQANPNARPFAPERQPQPDPKPKAADTEDAFGNIEEDEKSADEVSELLKFFANDVVRPLLDTVKEQTSVLETQQEQIAALQKQIAALKQDVEMAKGLENTPAATLAEEFKSFLFGDSKFGGDAIVKEDDALAKNSPENKNLTVENSILDEAVETFDDFLLQ